MVSTCPTHEILKRFLLGKLAVEEQEQVATHVIQCSQCLRTLDSLPASDVLLQAMQTPLPKGSLPRLVPVDQTLESIGEPTPPPMLPNAVLGQLVERLIQLGSPPGDTLGNPDVATPPSASEEIRRLLSPAQAPDELGRLGTYRVLKVLGSGGMGVVCLAEDTLLKRQVALKAMWPARADIREATQRFLREAQAAAALDHDHIVTIHQVGEERGVFFLAMQLLQGESLEDRLKRLGRLPVAEVVRIGREVAIGLAAAHARGLIHRDIKPANLWLDQDKGDRVKILDFGLARATGENLNLTESGAILGTPAYMAPEQARGQKVDARCDLFSLGCVLYRMVTGQSPFQASTTMGMLMALATATARPVRELTPEVPEALADLIGRLLAKEPAGRPASAQAVAAELSQIAMTLKGDDATRLLASGAVAATPATQPPTLVTSQVPPQRSRRWPLVVAALLIGLGAGVWFFAGTIIRIATDKGELVIETDDSDVQVIVKQGGATIIDRTKERRFDLSAKGGEVEFYDPDTGVRLLTKTFTLERGGKTVVQAKEDLARKPARSGELPVAVKQAGRYALECAHTWNNVSVPSLELDLRGPRTIEGYFTPTSKSGSGLGNNALLAWNDPSNSKGAPFLFCIHGLNNLWTFSFSANDQPGEDVPSALPMRVGEKTHVALVFTGRQFRLFIDGALAVTKDVSGLSFDKRKGTFAMGHYLTGLITEVRISKVARYDKDFTPAQRFEPDADTLALYHFDEGQGEVVKDSSGNAHHGKIMNAKWVKANGTPANPPGAAAAFSLDRLDPNKIPEAERFAWQPKELVAVLGEHRGRNWGAVQQLIWSPNGKFVATAGPTGVALWDPRTLRPRASIPSAGIVAISPDSKTLATAPGDLSVRLWDVTADKPKERTVIHLRDDGPLCLAFSPDGKLLAGGCQYSKTIRLWDMTAEKPKERAVLKGHTAEVLTVAFAPDGQTLASGSNDKTIRLWDLRGAEPKGKSVTTVNAPPGQLVFSPDGKTLAEPFCVPFGMFRLWDVTGAEPKEQAAVRGGEEHISGTLNAFSPDGKMLACSSPATQSLHLFDLTGKEPRVRAVLKRGTATSAAFAPDGKSLVTQCVVLRLWDLSGEEPREQVEPEGHLGPLSPVVLAPDGKTLATYAHDPVVRLWDLSGTVPRQRAELRHPGPVIGVSVSPDGKTLASCCHSNNTVWLWDLTGAEPEVRAQFKAAPGYVHAVAYSPDGKNLACYDTQGTTIHLWDVAGEEPKERAVLPNSVAPLAFSPDGKTLACDGLEKDGHRCKVLWDLGAAEPKEWVVLKPTIPGLLASGWPLPLAWAPDGKTLAATCFRGSYQGIYQVVQLWDLSGTTPRAGAVLELETPHNLQVTLAFAPDGQTIVVGEPKGVQLWDLTNRKKPKRRSLRLPGQVNGVTFAQDGRHLITANSNGTAYVLRLEP
jgi:WD40 repeat protein/serine/threonine protein kinase